MKYIRVYRIGTRISFKHAAKKNIYSALACVRNYNRIREFSILEYGLRLSQWTVKVQESVLSGFGILSTSICDDDHVRAPSSLEWQIHRPGADLRLVS